MVFYFFVKENDENLQNGPVSACLQGKKTRKEQLGYHVISQYVSPPSSVYLDAVYCYWDLIFGARPVPHLRKQKAISKTANGTSIDPDRPATCANANDKCIS